MMVNLNLTKLNWKPTQHRTNHRSTLLDIYITNKPEKFAFTENLPNFSGEHEAVMTKCSMSKIIQSYKKI